MKVAKRIGAFFAAAVMTTAMMTGCGKTSYPQIEGKTEGYPVAVIEVEDFGFITAVLYDKEAPKTVENFIAHAEAGYYDGITFHRTIPEFMIQGGDPNGDGSGGESIWGGSFEDEFTNGLRNFNGALSMANTGQKGTNGSQFFIVQQQDGSTLTEEYFESTEKSNKNAASDMYNTYKAQGADDALLKQVKEYTDGMNKGETDFPKEVKDYYRQVGGTPFLDKKHTVFGQVIDGMHVVDAISETPTGENDKPVEPVVIKSIKIQR